MEDAIKLLVISWKGCRPCEAMRRAKTVERFHEFYEDVKLEHHTLPPDWPELEGANATERLKLLASWSEAERTAVKVAEKYDVQGAPFVVFLDSNGEVIAEAPGAVNLTQLKDLYQDALEAAGGEEDADEGTAA